MIFFTNTLEKSINQYLDFWRELLEENPDIDKLQTLGGEISRNSVDIKK